MKRVLFSVFAVALGWVVSAEADDNVRAVQTKLKEAGFYLGEIDGAYSNQLSAALTRYQVRNGLPITGQLDVDTSKALGAKPGVIGSSKESVAADPARNSETWRRLRKSDEEFLKNMNAHGKPSAGSNEPTPAATDGSAPQATEVRKKEERPVPPTPPAEGPSTTDERREVAESNQSGTSVSTERLRDYVGAFVLAGLDPQVGAEADFFADRVQYYNDGVLSREKIRADLRRYDARWPDRRFWLAGDIFVERENEGRLRVSFPLRFELRNGEQHSSGKVLKTLVLQPSGDDFDIVEVNERKSK